MVFKGNYKKILIVTLVLSFCGKIYSQNALYNKENFSKNFKQGIELYNNKMYSAAYEKFNNILTTNKDYHNNYINKEILLGYELLCKISLKHSNVSGEVNNYEKLYSNSPLMNKIWYKYANYCFDKENFAEAQDYYNKIDIKSLDKDNTPEIWFKEGYCYKENNKPTDAVSNFYKITNGKYYYPAQYYLGYVYYNKKDFAQAIKHFEVAKKDNRFTQLSQLHIFESKFMLKDYSYVLKNGEDLHKDLKNEYKQRVARILSETYFATNNLDKANYYYELYFTNEKNITRNDIYYSGMLAYSLNNYREGINSFEKVVLENDSLAQSAYYYLGQCYINLKNKHKAQEAFNKAANLNFNHQLKEDAYFNYAKLTFDLTRNIAPFEEYLSNFEISNEKWDEIHTYMGTAFINSKNYNKAIESFNKIKNKNKVTENTLQKVYFLRGVELTSLGAYKQGVKYFNKAIDLSKKNINLNNISKYWLAECLYRIDDNEQAISILNSLENTGSFRTSNEYPTICYNRGYNNFKLQNYSKAIEDFSTYINTPMAKKEYYNEAKTRLADSYFMNKEYSKAAKLYEDIAATENYSNLYSPIQAAISYGLISNDTRKIEILESITSQENSNKPFYTKALYELSRTFTQNVKDNDAETTLKKLINNPPDSLYYYKALLELGMIKANAKKNDEALNYYKQIVHSNPISEEGQSALSGIENIYVSENKSEEFLAFLDEIGLSKTKTATEKETMLFNSAEQQYLGGNYSTALNSLKSFIDKYPNGENTYQALFYIAECYNKLGKKEEACEAYYKVMMNGDEGAFGEISTLNYGRLCYQLQKYDEAIKAYETLTKIAKLDNNITEGYVGKMEAYYMVNDYESAISSCNDVLNLTKIDNSLKRKANYIKAKSLQIKGNRNEALKLLKDVAKNKQDEYGAEAQYLLILDAYDAGEFKKVEDLTFSFSDSKTPQTYWLAKSFIILGDSYAERDNFAQAKATFESITQNYNQENKEEIFEQVNFRLQKINEKK